MKMRGDQIQERFNSGLKLFSILIMCAITGSSHAQWQITQAKKQSKGFDYYGLRVAYLQNGDYIVAGNLVDTIYLDKNNTIIPTGSSGIYLARFHSSDSLIWKSVFETTSSTSSVSLTEDIKIINNDNIVLAGSFKGSIRFPNGASKSSSSTDAFWMRYTTNGKLRALNTYAKAINSALAVNSDLTVAIGGRTLSNPAGAFICLYDSSGNFKSGGNHVFKGTSQNRDIVNALCFGPDNALYFSGKANGDSIGYGSFSTYIDAPNNINQYNLFFGKFSKTNQLVWLKGGIPMGKTRPFGFDMKQMLFQPKLNRILFSGKFEGANYQIGKDTLATTSLVNSDSRKPIILCTDTSGNLIWHTSLGLNHENQRGEIFTLTPGSNKYWVTADVEHYLNTPLKLGDVEFKFNNKAFLLLEMDSFGSIQSAFGTDPTQKYKVNNVLSTTFHPNYGLKLSLVNNASDSIWLTPTRIEKGSYILSGFPCYLKAEIKTQTKEICNNESSIQIGATPQGGYFSGAVISETGTIQPNKFNKGTYYYSYQIEDNNRCKSVAIDSIVIHEPTPVKFTNLDSVFCPKDTLIVLKSNVSGGSYLGNGVQGNTFNPSKAGTGIHTLFYNFINSNNCKSADTTQVRVRKQSECATNSSDVESKSHFNIYPNPSKGNIHIDFDMNNARAMSIRSIDGKVLKQLIAPFDENKIDVDSLPNGIYYCLIETNTGILHIAKFIVSND